MQARIHRRCPSGIAAMLLLALLPGRVLAEPADYAVDPVHTRIAFRVGHAGFSRALGTFAGATGTLRFDPDDWSTATLSLSVPVASLDLGDKEWNGKILDGTFFDAGKIAQATFASTAVDKLDEHRLRVRGNLTIHGVTQPVDFEATFNALKRHPLTFRRTAGFSAVLDVSRKAFGMGAWASVVDDRVEILVELEATRARGDAQDPAPTPAPTVPADEDGDATTEPAVPSPSDPPDDDDAAAA
jgi:polyisoprenoid-binding protein YceI